MYDSRQRSQIIGPVVYVPSADKAGRFMNVPVQPICVRGCGLRGAVPDRRSDNLVESSQCSRCTNLQIFQISTNLSNHLQPFRQIVPVGTELYQLVPPNPQYYHPMLENVPLTQYYFPSRRIGLLLSRLQHHTITPLQALLEVLV
jgi:hypothetical protein